MLQLDSAVVKGITRSAFGLKSCSCVSLLLCSMTQPFNAGIVGERYREHAAACHGCLITWVGSLVVKVCSVCAHGSHMAASAQLAGLYIPAISSGSL